MIGEEAELFFAGPRDRFIAALPTAVEAAASSGTEIDAAHDDAGRRALELPRLEFA